MTTTPPAGSSPQVGGVVPRMPQRGVFAVSEVLPMMAAASADLRLARETWETARTEAAQAKHDAKKLRADYIVYLRVWGAADTGNVPIKTSAERQEWADANPAIQQAELDADLKQAVAMSARAALDQAQHEFGLLQGMLGIERDGFKWERGEPT